jgi:copper resistance protein B
LGLPALFAFAWIALSTSAITVAQTTSSNTDQHDSTTMTSMPGMTMGSGSEGGNSAMQMAPMAGMDMEDNAAQTMVLIDQLEAVHTHTDNGQAWEAEGWYGTDTDKMWLRTEGNHDADGLNDADIEMLWSHAVSAFWNTQLGVRQDVSSDDHRTWAAFGVEGLAPYWFDVEATGYASSSGYTAARLRAEYALLFTQRWILQPEFETNLYSKGDPRDAMGSGVSDMQLGLRLRYDVTRQFAPYVGVVWIRNFGETADWLQQRREPVFDTQIVVGLHAWF